MKINRLAKLGKLNIVNNILFIYTVILLFIPTQHRTYLLEDIFPIENKKTLKKGANNNISQENLIDKKLTPVYIKKLSLLLYDSVNYKDYAIKRKNLNKTTFKEIGINKLRLTFKKFPIKLVKKNNSNINININNNLSRNLMPKTLDEIREQNDNSINNINDNNIYKTFMINNDIKKILYNNEETKIPLQQQKEVYNKFKYKFLYYKPKLISQLNSPIYTPIVQMNNNNKKISYKTTSFNNSLLNKSQTQSQNSIYTDIGNLLKTCNSLKALRDKKKLDKDIINNKQKLCEKIKEELFRKNKGKKKKKKIFISQYDFFYYDAKKWNKFRNKDYNNNSNKVNNINNLYNNVDKVFNESIQNVKNKSNFYNGKLLKLNNIKKSIKNSKGKINEYSDFE